MTISFVFTGIGFVTGEYEISNSEIQKYVDNDYLAGFNSDRIVESDAFADYVKSNSSQSAFNFMVEHIMGFKRRFHVVPFPPVAHNFKNAANSLDLCVDAIEKALVESGISGNEIDAWFVGTATPNQVAPGIAEFAKAYFTDVDNQAPTYSLTSACVGFNINLSNALDFFNSHPKAKHIIIAHSEVMSALLPEEKDFVPFTTFGDSAAAVVLSRVETKEKQGILKIYNREDPHMLDFLGADKKGNLYMNPRMVKLRAVPNIVEAAKFLINECDWDINKIDWFIPHQTGNAIVDAVAKSLNINPSKVFKEIQTEFGNLSGSSVPACLSLLKDSNRLLTGSKIVTAVAGLGGEYGGFAYKVPSEQIQFNSKAELDGKTIFITGASGGLGRQIALIAAKQKAKLILHYHSNQQAAQDLKTEIERKYGVNACLVKADLSNNDQVESLCSYIIANYKQVNYLINTHAITGSLGKATKVSNDEFVKVMNSNYLSIKNLCDNLSAIVKDCILITGSVGEDAQFPGSSSYVASKRALRAYSTALALRVYPKNCRVIYYLPGIIDSGMVDKLDSEQVKLSMMMAGQKNLISVTDIAQRMLRSVHKLKVKNVRISYESKLQVIKDGYLKF
jgi:3-oxoacyl-[acyl-carrier-protein] synthase III/NAD(P)-dependent dehydrogenase (short-subunit alcohol dehydrogenase family)